MSSLGKRIKSLRENAGYSQLRAAKIFGVTNVQLSRYEADIHKPDPDLLTKFADHYGVTTDYLLGRTDDPGTPGNSKENDPLSPEELELLDKLKDEEVAFKNLLGAPRETIRDFLRSWMLVQELEKNRDKK